MCGEHRGKITRVESDTLYCWSIWIKDRWVTHLIRWECNRQCLRMKMEGNWEMYIVVQSNNISNLILKCHMFLNWLDSPSINSSPPRSRYHVLSMGMHLWSSWGLTGTDSLALCYKLGKMMHCNTFVARHNTARPLRVCIPGVDEQYSCRSRFHNHIHLFQSFAVGRHLLILQLFHHFWLQ